MEAIIIPKNKIRFYSKNLDQFESIVPQELANGENFFNPDILLFLQSYSDNESFPASLRESARLVKLELESFELREITESDLKTGDVIVELFPYPDLNIRVFIKHSDVTLMYESEARPLLEYALNCTYVRDEIGYTIWLSRLDNPQMTAQQVRQILEYYGAQVLTK